MAAPKIINRDVLRQRRQKALRTQSWKEADFLLQWALEDVATRLSAVQREFETGLVIGAPQGLGRALLEQSGKVKTALEGDLGFEDASVEAPGRFIDEEDFPFEEHSLDLIVSVLHLQFANDLPGALLQMRRALKPDGLFMAVMVGGSSLLPLKQAFFEAESQLTGGVSPRVVPFADVRDLGALLQRAGLALPVSDVDRLEVRYKNPLTLFADLKAMGATNPLYGRHKGLMGKELFALTLQKLAEQTDSEGKLPIAFELVSLSGWAPHESQQKPLKPGSAKVSLKDVLQKPITQSQ